MEVEVRGYTGTVLLMDGRDDIFDSFGVDSATYVGTYTVELMIDEDTTIRLTNVRPEEIEFVEGEYK